MNLETERLIIRLIRASDLDDFQEYRSDPKVCEFQAFTPFTKETAEKFIAAAKDGEFGKPGEWIQLVVELKSENKVIGDVGLKPEGYDARVVEFGTTFSAKYQKKGFAREAVTKIISHLFENENIHRITAITDIKNSSAVKLVENLNFRREAEFRESFWNEAKNSWRDEYLYAMLEKDWRKTL